MSTNRVYINVADAQLREEPNPHAKVRAYALLGAVVEVMEERLQWRRVSMEGGHSGWIHRNQLSDRPCLKLRLLAFGQGDSVIAEYGQDLLIIDAGPNIQLHQYLYYKFGHKETIRIRAVVLTHPDYDHTNGIWHLLNDPRIHIDQMFHPGIIRYKRRPKHGGKKFPLGQTSLGRDGKDRLTETFSGIAEVQRLLDTGHLAKWYERMWRTAVRAHTDGRLGGATRITSRQKTLPGFSGRRKSLRVEVLGPVTSETSGRISYPVMADSHEVNPIPSEMHTLKGHVITLKLRLGNRTITLIGALNRGGQRRLLSCHDPATLKADAAVTCHHPPHDDFSYDFYRALNPVAHVYSIGDPNKVGIISAPGLGAAVRRQPGGKPLLFLNQHVLRVQLGGTHVLGKVVITTNGQVMEAAQASKSVRMMEKWDSYIVPTETFAFVSYARTDRRFVRNLTRRLVDHNIELWVDVSEIETSDNWPKAVEEALNACSRLLLVLSPQSIRSQQVRAEIDVALKRGIPIIPIVHKRCTAPETVTGIQQIDFTDTHYSKRAAFNRLVTALQ